MMTVNPQKLLRPGKKTATSSQNNLNNMILNNIYRFIFFRIIPTLAQALSLKGKNNNHALTYVDI